MNPGLAAQHQLIDGNHIGRRRRRTTKTGYTNRRGIGWLPLTHETEKARPDVVDGDRALGQTRLDLRAGVTPYATIITRLEPESRRWNTHPSRLQRVKVTRGDGRRECQAPYGD